MPECVFDHVHLFTGNVEQTVEFYKSVFKAEELRRLPQGRTEMVHLSLGGCRIVISAASEEKPAGIHHFAIATDQFDEIANRLKGRNVRFETEIGRNGIYRNVFFRDPNQIVVELVNPSTK